MGTDREIISTARPHVGVRPWMAWVLGLALMVAATGCGTTSIAKSRPPRQPTAAVHPPVAVGSIRRIAFIDSSSGWMAFTPPGAPSTIEIAYTGNGGTTWTRTTRFQVVSPGGWTWVPLGRRTLLVVVSSPLGTGSLHRVLTTTDRGQAWKAAQFYRTVGPGYVVAAKTGSSTACALVASEPSLGGVAASLYCGRVGGQWHQVTTRFGSAPGGFLPGLFPNGLTMVGRQAWITGQNVSSGPDIFYASNDTGRSFQAGSAALPPNTNADTWPVVVTPGAAPALPVIAYVPSGAAFVLYHQNSHGAWQATTPVTTHASPLPPGALLYSAASTQILFVRGQHTLYATTNGGTTSTPVYHSTAGWSAMQFTSATQGWAVAGPATLLHTGDGGRTWTTVRFRVFRHR